MTPQADHRSHLADEIAAQVQAQLCAEAPLTRALSLTRSWTPGGDRVELVQRSHSTGGLNTRPGVVVAVDRELQVCERLRVRFDDGEETHINPDVMRHRSA